MTHQLFKLPKEVYFGGGLIQAGWKVEFFLTGTTTPTPVYTTSALSTAHTQPVVADSSGVMPAIYLDPTISYKASVYNSANVLQYTIDPVNDSVLSQAIVGQTLWPRTAAEISAGVTPSNYHFCELDIRRYGAVGDNSTECSGAINAAIDVAAINGGTVRIPYGRFKITSSIELSAKVNICGDGYGSVIECNGVDAITIGFVASFGKIVLSDFYINGTSCTTKVGIYQAGTLNDADELYGLTISRVLITDFNKCVSLRNVRVLTIENCWFQDTNIGMDFTGKILVANIVGNEAVYAAGCGSGTKAGIILDNFNFTSGTGIVGTEGIQICRNQFYGFDYGVRAINCFFANIDKNDIQALVRGIEYETVQYVLNITDNYVELSGSSATQGIHGKGLSSVLSTKVNIVGNAIDGSSLSTCSGIQVNDSGNQNQNYVSIVRNRIRSMPTYDIIMYGAGHGVIEDNRCESTSPTYSIRVDSVVTGIVHVDKNKCYKDIYFDPAEAAAGEVVLGVNWKNNGTIQFGAQHVPSVASASSLTLPLGVNIFLITGSTSITSISATGWAGREVTLISSGGTWTLVDGSNLMLAADFVATSNDAIRLVCDGTNWYTAGGPSAN